MDENAYALHSYRTENVHSTLKHDQRSIVTNGRQLSASPEPAPRFAGGTVTVRTGSRYRLERVTAPGSRPLQVHLSPDRGADRDYRLMLVLAGALIGRHGEVEITFTPGSAGLAAPLSALTATSSDHADFVMLTIPHHEINRRLGDGAPLLAPVDLSSGLGLVVLRMLQGLFAVRHRLPSGQFEAACDRLVELLCVVLDHNAPVPRGRLAEVEAAARRYVRENLGDRDLTGSAVARAIGWSIRQVQLALREAGTTPHDLIQDERLRLARDLLRQRTNTGDSITQIALSCGFTSIRSFSSAFRRRYGVSPREFRRRAL